MRKRLVRAQIQERDALVPSTVRLSRVSTLISSSGATKLRRVTTTLPSLSMLANSLLPSFKNLVRRSVSQFTITSMAETAEASALRRSQTVASLFQTLRALGLQQGVQLQKKLSTSALSEGRCGVSAGLWHYCA